MLGIKVRQTVSVPAVSLEDLVPPDHFYRHLEQVLDLTFVRQLVQDGYAANGRPSSDPVVFFKLQLVMFFEGIRSERHLMRLVADRLSIRWYLGYNLHEPLPDHSSLTRIRTRYGLEVFRRFFDTVVEQCQDTGLVWGRELYFDATQVHADAALDSLAARFAFEARAPLHAHLAALFPEEMSHLAPQATLEQEHLRAVPSLAQAAPPTPLPVELSDAHREDLAATNAARHDWIAEEGRQQREVHGIRQRTADVRISTTDPDATPMRLKGGGTHLGYQTHYVVDGGKARIIVGVLVTPGEVTENHPMRDLLWRARFRWKLRVYQVTGDTKYGTTENIRAVEDMGIRAYVPLPDWEKNSPYFGTSRFHYDAERDYYVCPNGQMLRRTHTDEAGRRIQYRAQASTCRACPLKEACTPAVTVGRSVWRSFGEEYLERVQSYQATAAYQKALRKRKVWVEPLFAEAKQWHGARRFRLRRLWRVNTEALMIATGQNLMRLLAQAGWGRRPLPSGATLAVTRQGKAVWPGFILMYAGCSTCGRHRQNSGRQMYRPSDDSGGLFQHARSFTGQWSGASS